MEIVLAIIELTRKINAKPKCPMSQPAIIGKIAIVRLAGMGDLIVPANT